MKKERWVVSAKRADFQAIADRFGIDPVIARLIRNRDVTGEKEIEEYLFGDLEQLHDPLLMKDMERAADLIAEKIREKKPIRIIGDYDIDGVTATYILLTGLKDLGADVDVRIPDRIADGYGLNEHLVQFAADEGRDTIVTCDNGIAAGSQIRLAKELGMTVVVTDHHEVPFEVDENGEFYRTEEERTKQSDTAYKASHTCPYSYFPQYTGTSDDGINANKPDGQASEFFDGLNQDVKETFEAYGVETYVEMLGTNEAPGDWYPMWSFSNNFTTDTPGGVAWNKIADVKHEQLPQVVMAKDFDAAWDTYMDAYNACHPEDFISELQTELDTRMEQAAKFK